MQLVKLRANLIYQYNLLAIRCAMLLLFVGVKPENILNYGACWLQMANIWINMALVCFKTAKLGLIEQCLAVMIEIYEILSDVLKIWATK